MKALVQRVSKAAVAIDGKAVAKTGQGIVILLGIGHADSERDAEYLADKCVNLRIFEDSAGKMNLSLLDVKGDAMIVPQFTLYGDCRKGKRPSYTDAAHPGKAIPLYERFIREVRKHNIKVETGRFAAMMDVQIHNQGPVTLLVESK